MGIGASSSSSSPKGKGANPRRITAAKEQARPPPLSVTLVNNDASIKNNDIFACKESSDDRVDHRDGGLSSASEDILVDDLEGPSDVSQLPTQPPPTPAAPQQHAFHEVLNTASYLLRARQRENKTLTQQEMEDLVLLTREMETLKQIMKHSQFTVEGTWGVLEKEGTVMRFGQQLYDELLTKNPLLRVFFYDVDLDEQAKMLVRMLGSAVHFYNKPEVTVAMFTKAGARHRGYGVTSEVLVEMKNMFFEVFPKFVGADVFAAAEEEWRKFWKMMLDLLEHGSRSKEGERYGEIHEQQTFKKLQADFKILVERQDKCKPRDQFVGVMYAKAIEMYGDLSKFDALKDLRASKRVFQSYIDIVASLSDKERVRDYLTELGARHTAYNVTVENLHSFTEPFLFACRHFLQQEWNVAMEARFHWAFQYMVSGISDGMLRGFDSLENSRAPSCNMTAFCLVFTDIEASTKLWQRDPVSMGYAIKQHHRLIRGLIAEYSAYEVKTVGDSFIIAAKDVYIGVKIALSIQMELMRMAPISPGFRMVEETEGRGDPSAWSDSTLRVRIGIEHCTQATATYDSIHRRYDYYGPSVNRCARIESAACGGQILMSRKSFEALKQIPDFHDEPCPGVLRAVDIPSPSIKLDARGLDHFVAVSDVGMATLKGLGESVHLVSMVPRCFSGRQFINKPKRISKTGE